MNANKSTLLCFQNMFRSWLYRNNEKIEVINIMLSWMVISSWKHEGFVVAGKEDLFYKLHKSLLDLKISDDILIANENGNIIQQTIEHTLPRNSVKPIWDLSVIILRWNMVLAGNIISVILIRYCLIIIWILLNIPKYKWVLNISSPNSSQIVSRKVCKPTYLFELILILKLSFTKDLKLVIKHWTWNDMLMHIKGIYFNSVDIFSS